MNLKAAFLATAAGAFLFVAACGGGGDGESGNSSGNTGSGGDTGSGNGSGGSGSGSTASSCQPQTVVGGDLLVAQQGPVGVTLVSSGVMTAYTFSFLYDNVFGIPTNNQQDKWGAVAPPPFPPGTPVGTSMQVQLQPFTGFVHGEQTPSTFPKGIPIELWFFLNNTDPPGPAKSSSTASIGKDIPNDFWHTASVTYGANSTATVTFFLGGVPSFAVSLTNVSGKDAPTGC